MSVEMKTFTAPTLPIQPVRSGGRRAQTRLAGVTQDTAPAAPELPAELVAWSEGPPAADGQLMDGAELRDPQWQGLALRRLRLDGVAVRAGDLSRAELTDPAWRDVLLEDTSLANALVRGGQLERVAVAGARLTGATLAEVGLRNMELRDCGADLMAFRHCTLERVSFASCGMREADFMGASLEGVTFADCDLSGASFARASCSQTTFRRCRMDAVEGLQGLSGAAMDVGMVMALAAALGIDVLDN
jgi:hypothetical protein